MNLVILLDVDGVLADFNSPVLKYINALTGKSLTPNDVTDWQIFDLAKPFEKEAKAFCLERGFCANLEPYPGAQDAVKRLQELGDVHIVTSPFHGSAFWHHERVRWLENHFSIHEDKIHFTHQKELIRGNVLIDDKPETIYKWIARNERGISFLWEQPYNTMYEAPVYSWKTNSFDKIVNIIKNVSNIT